MSVASEIRAIGSDGHRTAAGSSSIRVVARWPTAAISRASRDGKWCSIRPRLTPASSWIATVVAPE